MSRDDIIRMARDAGKYADAEYQRAWEAGEGASWQSIRDERFAALVAAHEREECAKVCDEQQDRARTSTGAARADACAAAIRARGQT